MARFDRLERLTDLVLVLLNTRRPLSLDEIAHQVPGYPPSHDARRQAFERDKRLLREEGIPVETTAVEGPEQFGYLIEPDAFYLPDLQLAPDEQAALHLAVACVHLGDPSGRDALAKLGATGLTEARPVAALVPPPALVPLFEALRSRASATFAYRGEQRSVAPGGLWFRNGHWYLVGWDEARGAGRTFRVDRLEGPPDVGRPDSGLLPEGYDPTLALPDEAWRADDDSGPMVRLVVDAIEAPRVVDEVGERCVVERRPDGSVVLEVATTGAGALRSWLLGLLDHAEVLGPPAVRAELVAWLEALARTEAPENPTLPPLVEDGGGMASPATAEAGGRDASTRLRRLLAMVGWLAQVGEASIAEVSRRFDLGPDELVHELELAACCGLPPYSPDVLMEIVVTEDTVQAFLPEAMARPRRLTPAEGFALAAAGRTILAVPGADQDGALARALAKLAAALGTLGQLVVDLDQPPRLDEVRQALAEGRQLEIEYHSASTDETTRRIVDPEAVIALDGHWYLDAYCHRAGDHRRFRVDRIGAVRDTGPVDPGRPARPPVGSASFVPGPGARLVTLDVGPEAWWVADSVPVLAVGDGPDGHLVLRLAVGGTAWLERLLLQLGPSARVLDPPELADVGPAAARRLLERYAASS